MQIMNGYSRKFICLCIDIERHIYTEAEENSFQQPVNFTIVDTVRSMAMSELLHVTCLFGRSFMGRVCLLTRDHKGQLDLLHRGTPYNNVSQVRISVCSGLGCSSRF